MLYSKFWYVPPFLGLRSKFLQHKIFLEFNFSGGLFYAKRPNLSIFGAPSFPAIWTPNILLFRWKIKISVTKLILGLSIGFQNGKSWPHRTKTHILVWVLGKGSFPDQVPLEQAHLPNYMTFVLSKLKSYSFFTLGHTDRQVHILHPYMHRNVLLLY